MLTLTEDDVIVHRDMLRKWLPVYYLGPFSLSESREREYLDRFIETFSDENPKEKE